MVDCNPYDLGDVAAKMRRMVNERASLAGPLADEVNRLRRELAEIKAQHNDLLAVLKAVEWISIVDGDEVYCPWCREICYSNLPESWHHNDDCQRQGALAAVKGR